MEQLQKELLEFLNANPTTYAAYFRFNNPKYIHLKNFVKQSIKDTLVDSDYYNWSVKCYWALHSLKDFPKCKICGKPLGKDKKSIHYEKGYGRFCSSRCEAKDNGVKEKQRQTNLKKYGFESSNQSQLVKEKKRQSFQNHYGVNAPGQAKEIQDKIKETMLSRYGVKNAYNLESTIQRRKEVSLEKYGTETPIANPTIHQLGVDAKIEKYGSISECSKIIRKKADKTKIEKYGSLENFYRFNGERITKSWNKKRFEDLLKSKYVEPLFSIKEFDNLYGKEYKWKCKKCGKEFESIQLRSDCGFFARCPDCFPQNTSREQIELQHFIRSCGVQIKENDRQEINPLELDIYIPEKQLAIEFDGLYWHSDIDKNYHLNKTKLCEEKGIHLIHIFENEWLFKQNIVKSRLKNLLGLYDHKCYARECEVREIDANISKHFQNENHIQGSASALIHLGLFYNNELVSLMTFGKSRFSKKYDWELVRFCNKLWWHIPGSASKLFNYFKETYHSTSIVSYADRRWTMNSGNTIYDKLGFKFDHLSYPNYWYFKQNSYQLESRIKYQKHKLKNLLENFNQNKTEVENMRDNGYKRIFDCGNIVYIWRPSK